VGPQIAAARTAAASTCRRVYDIGESAAVWVALLAGLGEMTTRGNQREPRVGSPLALGIVGCGRFATEYHLPALAREARCVLAAICEPAPTPELKRRAATTNVPIVESVDELLGAHALDAALISTPHAVHAELIGECLSAGLHVLVDKPFVLELADAERLTLLAEKQELVAGVGFNRRVAEAYLYGRHLITSGALGEIRHVDSLQLGYPSEGWYAEASVSGGPFLGRGAHLADVVPWLLDSTPLSIVARAAGGGNGSPLATGGWWDVEFPGVRWRATILPHGLAMYDEVRIFGEEGYVIVRRPTGNLTWPPRTKAGAAAMLAWEAEHYDRGKGSQRPSAPPEAERRTLVGDFVDAVIDGNRLACSFREAIGSVAITAAATESCLGGGERLPLSDLLHAEGL